jgi:hypothetical protein
MPGCQRRSRPPPHQDCSPVWHLEGDCSQGWMPRSDTMNGQVHSALKRMKRIVRDEGAGDSGQRPWLARLAVERFASTAQPIPLAIRPHPLERFRPFRGGSLGDTHQLADAESPDERGGGEIREVVLCVLGKMPKAEHLRHSRFAKALLLTNLDFGQCLVFLQTPLPVEHSPDGMPRRLVVLLRGLFRQPALCRGFHGEVERLRHERSQIVLVVGKAQNQPDPEGSS